jgi:hypothetical protein
MTKPLSEAASTILLLSRWRLLTAEHKQRRARDLQASAQQCFRLAHGGASAELAAELEAIGRDFDREAKAITDRVQAAAYQVCYPGFHRQKEPMSLVFGRLLGTRLV